MRVCGRIRPLSLPPSSSSSPRCECDGDDDPADVGGGGGGDRAADDLRPRAYALAPDAENAIIAPSSSSSSPPHSEDDDAARRRRRRQRQRRYEYDRVYGESSDTSSLYVEMVSDIVRSVVRRGRNGTVFAYGQTSTGE